MKSWDLNKTRRLVVTAFGEAQGKLVQESVRSVIERQRFCSYHFQEAMRLSKTFEKKHMVNLQSLLELQVLGAEKHERAFQLYILKAGAHSIAAVQSLHAIPDIFAHVIYFATAQNLQSYTLNELEISLPTVIKCLKKDATLSKLTTSLVSLQSGENWTHLAAVSNASKHRSVIRSAYNEDMSGIRTELRELQFSSFTRKQEFYPAISLKDLLAPEYDRLSKIVVNTGNQLIDILEIKAELSRTSA
ncbi:hypothetical protein [Methylovorus glucosotrophus]|uniref:Uncharacterized protein n=1 Tax=Methylovorus glucosotrophus (strain SIP3-4) TaxID=582744 RepID=C6XAK2_METGS|nr:hypothetical protein [Methylovorus glucosotrophus]ACT49934.1 hypothetical protein Msip34_0686 [Methylovorus glucosotrophus SIP3-4]